MKVTHPPASPGGGKRGKGAPPPPKRQATETPSPATPSEQDPSETARLLETGTEVVRQLPGASPERIQELKKQIQDGTYQPDAADVAERLIDEHLKAKLDE